MGNRRWLQNLIVKQYLPAIQALDDTPQSWELAQQWADWMKAQWADHGLNTLKQQRTLMTEVRSVIKQQLGPDHFALESMNFTKAEWYEMNEEIGDRIANRNENQQFIDNPDEIVEKAMTLLLSREWSDVATGLVVLTGRRCAEIMSTAEFEYKSPYSVMFTGSLKRRGEKKNLSFEIPTLAPANQIIDALGKLRKWIPAQNLSATDVNQKYSDAVVRACDRAFHDLVPLREGRDKLYTHLFRTIYAQIATHWYAPPQIADMEYMAAIQGHYVILEETDASLRRSLAASRHYNDYKIGDGKGNIDGRQGIKLNEPGVEVIEVFKSNVESKAKKAAKRKTTSRRWFYQDEIPHWEALLDMIAPEGNKPARMSQFLKWIEAQVVTTYTQPDAQTQPEEADSLEAMETEAEEQIPPEQSSKMDPATAALIRVADRMDQAAAALIRVADRMDQASATQTSSSVNHTSRSRTPRARTPQPETNGSREVAAKTQPAPPQNNGLPQQTLNAEAKVNYAIDEIIKHNCQPELPRDQMWAITSSLLKQATKCYQGVINRVLKQRQDEIESHHQHFGLGTYHNNVHRSSGESITDIVQID